MNTQIFAPRRLVAALIAAGFLTSADIGAIAFAHAETATPMATAQAASLTSNLPDFSALTDRYGPAVVNISITGVRKTSNERLGNRQMLPPGMDPNDPLYQFFRQFQGPGAGEQQEREMPTHAMGSGFIISPNGIILTNAHVVDHASEVTVKLTDRREFRAKVLGSDPKTDVAVLKIDAKNLPTVTLGNTRDLKVGAWVLAIGSPFGFENSVTVGVVSAKGRSLPNDGFVPFLQTDVAVNPGNSGGPLFNTRGEVIGINSQIFSETGGYQGLSFAIPIDLAVRVKDQIVATGKASHARLGVTIQDVNQTLADSFKLDKPEGALISSINPGSPADKAGLQPGDIVRKVDGQPIESSGDLSVRVGQATPGEKVTLGIWRQGKSKELTVTLGNTNDTALTMASADNNTSQGQLGLALRPLQPQEKKTSGIKDGLLIEDTAGPAAKAGVQPGDVLLAINGTPVKSIEQVREMITKMKKSVALLIQRGDSQIFVPVHIG